MITKQFKNGRVNAFVPSELENYLNSGGDIGDETAHEIADPYERHSPRNVEIALEGWVFSKGGLTTRAEKNDFKETIYWLHDLQLEHIISHGNGEVAKRVPEKVGQFFERLEEPGSRLYQMERELYRETKKMEESELTQMEEPQSAETKKETEDGEK